MATGTFQVVFRGEVTGEQPVEVVKQQLATLFRMPAERVEALFSGKPVVVKKQVDEATARKLEQAFAKAGAVCEVRSTEEAGAAASGEASAPADPGSGAAPEPSGADTARQDDAGNETAGGSGSRRATGSGSIAAAGDPNGTLVDLAVPESFGDLAIDESETPLAPRTEHPAPEIDTTELSLSEADAGPLSDRRPPPPPEIDTSGLSMERLDGES